MEKVSKGGVDGGRPLSPDSGARDRSLQLMANVINPVCSVKAPWGEGEAEEQTERRVVKKWRPWKMGQV